MENTMTKNADKPLGGVMDKFSGWDPSIPSELPDKYQKAIMKALYVPSSRGQELFIAELFANELGDVKLNQALMEGLKLWIEKMFPAYLEKLLSRLNKEEEELSLEIKKLKKKKTAKLEPLETERNKVQNGKIRIELKLKELRNRPQERYQHFFYSTLTAMAECGYVEMYDCLHSLDVEKMQENYENDLEKHRDDMEDSEYGRLKHKSNTKRSVKKNKTNNK
jgi:hypothetical protein